MKRKTSIWLYNLYPDFEKCSPEAQGFVNIMALWGLAAWIYLLLLSFQRSFFLEWTKALKYEKPSLDSA